MKTALTVLALTLLVSCRRIADEPLPGGISPCLLQLIEQSRSGKFDTDFVAIYRYTYQNQHVYLGVSDCCDRFNLLYDQTCRVLCAPSGGISGGGDGKCPAFSGEATEGTLLWKRPR